MDEIANYSNGPVSGKPVKSGKKLFEQVKEGLQNGKAPPEQEAPARAEAKKADDKKSK
ncbi:MAG: hypothetical protein Unbinned2301contig1004_17 [Prokaryotic dsDNA virus sp.]|nr:MAG: hypothetical protein Unbinned2301contig1004_17 [Prokaryotic dsDNA virus sp.]